MGGRAVCSGALQLLLQVQQVFQRQCGDNARRWRTSLAGVTVAGLTLAGCVSDGACLPTRCGGPERLIPIETELAPIREGYDYPNVLAAYRDAPSDQQRMAIRNEFLYERIYAIDVYYTAYEENLTREGEDQGFLAAVTNAALTGTAALIPVQQTTRILAGIAAGLTTADQAYNKQYLLSKTVQILQSQMRSDRADILTHIIARTGYDTTKYPLGMAMADLEQYYRAGTLSGAFISLGQTTNAKADTNKQGVNNIKPGAEKAATALHNPTPPQVTTPSSPPVRIQGQALQDTAGDALIKFIYPNGISGGANRDSIASVQKFLTDNKIGVSWYFFLRSSNYAAQRATLAHNLGLIN